MGSEKDKTVNTYNAVYKCINVVFKSTGEIGGKLCHFCFKISE